MTARGVLAVVLALALLGGPVVAAQAVTEGLVSYWPFDEGRGKTAKNAAGGNNVKVHRATWVKGVKGRALEFDGKNAHAYSDYCDRLDFRKGDFTVEAWVQTVGLDPMAVIGNQWNKTRHGFGIYLREGKPYVVAMEHYEPERKYQRVDGVTYIADEDWHQLVLVRQGDTISVYVDGELDKARRVPVCDICPPGKDHEGNWIGVLKDRPEPMWPFEGAIDEVRLYHRALTPEEIKQNYEATSDL